MPGSVASTIAARLAHPEVRDPLLDGLANGSRLALSLFATCGTLALPAAGLFQALRSLGVEPAAALRPLLESGLVALREVPDQPVPAIATILDGNPLSPTLDLLIYPAFAETPTVLPAADRPPTAGPAGQIREADGLEPLLRLAALWQLAIQAPFRQTQQGSLFKRDRERLTDEPVLAGPIIDAIATLPDMARLWLALARGIGLLVEEPGGDRLNPAPADFWVEHAVHLPQMLGHLWLGLNSWQEVVGWNPPEASSDRSSFLVRPVVLLWLAAMEPDDWVAIEDLESHLDRMAPDWAVRPADSPENPSRSGRGRTKPEGADTTSLVRAILLGPAYQFGLVRIAEEVPGRRRTVQITPLGRYVLGIGPPPAPRETFEQFLVVQPNYEIIAYRQGLNPWLIGLLSRFLDWTQLGAAVELKLSAEAVYRGLESGLPPEQMTGRLERHSGRPLPAAVVEAFRTWSGRRERLTFHTSATLIEFVTSDDLTTALADWPTSPDQPGPERVSDRILLVPEGVTIPYQRFRLAGSRDYRQPAEPCVEVEPDGVTLSVDLGRTDLLIDAELSRLADPLTNPPRPVRVGRAPRRWFVVSRGSLSRAMAEGMTTAQIEQWFQQRTGTGPPAAVRLLLHVVEPSTRTPFRLQRLVVLHAPSPDLLDGLFQHPDTHRLMGERLGPQSVVVSAEAMESLRRVAADLGLTLDTKAS